MGVGLYIHNQRMDDVIQGEPRVNRGEGNFTLKGRAEVGEQRDHDSQRIEDIVYWGQQTVEKTYLEIVLLEAFKSFRVIK